MSFATSISSGDTSDTDWLLPFGSGPFAPSRQVLLPTPFVRCQEKLNEPRKGTAMVRYRHENSVSSSRKLLNYRSWKPTDPHGALLHGLRIDIDARRRARVTS